MELEEVPTVWVVPSNGESGWAAMVLDVASNCSVLVPITAFPSLFEREEEKACYQP